MGDTCGTIRALRIDGIPYDVIFDADITETHTKYLVETVPTSGRNMKKMTARAQVREGVVIACNPSEAEILKSLAESSRDNIPMSYTLADDSVYTCEGYFEFENRTTMENRATLKLFNRTAWEPFVA
jgi:hypothetical protein